MMKQNLIMINQTNNLLKAKKNILITMKKIMMNLKVYFNNNESNESNE